MTLANHARHHATQWAIEARPQLPEALTEDEAHGFAAGEQDRLEAQGIRRGEYYWKLFHQVAVAVLMVIRRPA